MTGRRSIACLAVLCALVLGVISAPNAAAAGTTTVTCKVPENGDEILGDTVFAKEHCTAADQGSGEYRHVVYGPNTPTDLEVRNDTTAGIKDPIVLHTLVAGVEVQVEATELNGTGTIENKEAGEERYVQGSLTATFSGVTVAKPAGKGCKVKLGEFKTKELTLTSKELGMAMKIAPVSGSLIGSFEVEGCSVSALNGLYEITGSIPTSEIDGATTKFTPILTTAAATLKVRGQKAGLSASTTLKGRDTKKPGDFFKPLTQTTN